MRGLTPRQIIVLEMFYRHRCKGRGKTRRPTLRDIAEEYGCSKRGAIGHILPLCQKGYLEHRGLYGASYKFRPYQLTKRGLEFCRARRKKKRVSRARIRRRSLERAYWFYAMLMRGVPAWRILHLQRERKGWKHAETTGQVHKAANKYADKRGLPRPPSTMSIAKMRWK